MGTGSAAAFGGLPGLVSQSIDEIELDLKKDVLGTIIFTGGTSQHKMLADRMLQTELPREALANYRTKTIFSGRNDCRIFSWIGASIIGSLSTFDSLVLTKKDYEEHGFSLIERKFN